MGRFPAASRPVGMLREQAAWVVPGQGQLAFAKAARPPTSRVGSVQEWAQHRHFPAALRRHRRERCLQEPLAWAAASADLLGPAGFVTGAAACGLSLGAGTTSDCGSSASSAGGSLSGFAAGTGAVRGVGHAFFAGRGLRCFGALCCGEENSFSSQVGAANESVGGRRKIPKIVMAKASRGIDSLPMAVNDFDHKWLHG